MIQEFIYVVYETDVWHTLATRKCCGIFKTQEDAIDAIVENNRIDDMDENGIRRELADNRWQTQGHETNYEIEQWLLNDWSVDLF